MSVNIYKNNQLNKVAGSGSGSNVDILATAEDVSANTDVGKVADAVVTKGIIDSLSALDDGEKYTTTEQKTAKTWIDGKHIYRTVVPCLVTTLDGDGGQGFIHNIQNIEYITNIEYIVKLSDSNYINGYVYNDQILWVRASASEIRVGTLFARVQNQTVYVTLEYTKTTD